MLVLAKNRDTRWYLEQSSKLGSLLNNQHELVK